MALPPTGPFSEQSLFTQPLIRVGGKNGTWLTLGSKYAPFGYVPAEARGMPAYLLSNGTPKLTRTPKEGMLDDMAYEGTVKLQATVGRELRGIQLSQYRVDHFDDLDSPLLIHVQGHVQSFAERSSGALVVSPPFGARLSQLAVLPVRQTPLLLVDATHQRIKLKLDLPPVRPFSDETSPASAAGDRW